MLSIRTTIAVLALPLLAVACSDTPTTPEGEASTTPRAGSTYRYHRYNADTSGIEMPGSGDTAVTSVVSTSAQHAGQTAVHVFVQGSDTVARLRYESNGDVRYFPSWGAEARVGWLTLPLASKGSTDMTLRDTTIELIGGEQGQERVTLSTAYMSSEQVMVGAESIETHRVRMRLVSVIPLSAELAIVDTATHTVWYAPALGFFTRIETAQARQDPYGTTHLPTAVNLLTAYELK